MKRLVVMLLAAACLVASAAEPAQDAASPIDLRRDVLAYHIGKGATPEQACAAVLRYFGGVCATDGATFTLADAPGLAARFYAVITLDR